MDKIAVLIPCYNESLTIKKVIEDWKSALPEAKIYVYDNNSTDNTAEIAMNAGATVKYEYQQGKGNVIRRMFREIDAESYIMIDGDDTYPAEHGREMVELVLNKNVDMVVGDRLSSTYFEENKNSYETELKSLDDEFKDIVANGRHRMIVVADKFPFRYFAQEYGLSYRAAFSGCSTDTEPSAKTIAYLIDRIKENQIQAVFYLELSSHRTADIISEETGAKPLLLHSCHNVTRRQFDEGVTYLQLMKQNAKNLQEALL